MREPGLLGGWGMRRNFLQAGALLLAWVALLAGAAPGRTQEPRAAERLTLDQAVQIALKEHPAVKQARENLGASRAAIGVARAAYFPQVSFAWNYFYGNAFTTTQSAFRTAALPPAVATPLTSTPTLNPEATNFYIYRFSLNQLIYDFGKTPNSVVESRASFGGSQQDYFSARQQVVLDLRTAYFGYLAARRAMQVQEETVRDNQELLRQARGFYQAGIRARIDVTKAEANLSQAEAGLLQAKNNVELAKVTLMNALGIKTWPYREVEDVLEAAPQPRHLEELLAKAGEQRPELVKNRFQQDYGVAAVKVARAGYFPQLSSTASYGWEGFDYPLPNSWWLGAQVTFPLFEGLATKYSVAQSRANLRATRENYEVLRQNATKEVSQAYLNVKSGWELISAAKKSREAARENLRLARGRYRAGVGTIIEATDAQVQFSQADLNYVQALYNYRVFEAQLDKAVGKPY